MSKNVFTEELNFEHKEVLPDIDYNEFKKVIKSRRSIRVFTDEVVPDDVIENALEDGLLAPNSSNLQAWEFHWVKSDELKKKVAYTCFSQNGAKTASHIIVCVAKTNTWKAHCKLMLEELSKSGQEVPKVVQDYYTRIAPMAYGLMGPFGILSPFKWLFLNTIGLFNVMAREPIFPSDLKNWASKSTALAAENIMLSLRAQGYDSLPMEGFDSKRLKKVLGLNSRHDHIVMCIGVGKRNDKGVYGPQFRFDSARFIKKHS